LLLGRQRGDWAMKRQAGIGALLLVCVGVVLGATVFRSDIAQATGLKQSQSVIVDNGPGKPVPVQEQNLDGGNIRVHEEGTAAVRLGNEEVSVSKGGDDVADPFCEINGIYTVPAGKDLVVEYISGTLEPFSGTDTGATGKVFSPSGGELPLVFVEQQPNQFAASEAVHFVFPAGSLLDFLGVLGGASSCTVAVSIGGYLQPSS